MPDALQVEFQVLGIDEGVQEMRRFAREMAKMQADTDIGMGRSGVSAASRALDLEKRRLQVVAQRQQMEIRAQRQSWAEEKRMQAVNGVPSAISRRGNMNSVYGSRDGDGLSRFEKALTGPIERALHSDHHGARWSEGYKMVGDVAQMFGPWGQAIKATTDMLYSLDNAGRAADASLRSMRALQYESGGTVREQARAGVYAEALGMEPKGFTRLSREFSDRITSDPYAMHYAGQYGVHDAPGPMNGKLDKMQQLLDWTDKLRQMSDPEAMRAARATGTEDILPMRGIPEVDYQRLKYASEFEASRNSKEQMDRAMQRVTQDVANGAINPPPWQNAARDSNYDWSRGDPHPMLPRGENGQRLPDFDTWRRQQGQGGSNAQERQTTAAERTANATEGIHALIRAGQYGGGERAQGAIPSAFTGSGYQIRQLTAMSHALGAFSL